MKLIFVAVLTLAVVPIKSEFIDSGFWENMEFPDSLPEEFYEKSVSNRIFGGVTAKRGAFPYHVGLVAVRKGVASWCSGALLSNTTVITTANCVDLASYIDVYLGAHEIRDTSEPGRINKRVTNKNVVVHKGYNSTTGAFDIAIIRLPEAIEFNSWIKPVGLPTFADEPADNPDKYAELTGWGRIANDTDGISEELRYTTVSILRDEMCKHYFGAKIQPSHICTETIYGSGTCRGDSGAPAVVDNKLLGLTSLVNPIGCLSCLPTVLIRITYFLDWIGENSDVMIKL